MFSSLDTALKLFVCRIRSFIICHPSHRFPEDLGRDLKGGCFSASFRSDTVISATSFYLHKSLEDNQLDHPGVLIGQAKRKVKEGGEMVRSLQGGWKERGGLEGEGEGSKKGIGRQSVNKGCTHTHAQTPRRPLNNPFRVLLALQRVSLCFVLPTPPHTHSLTAAQSQMYWEWSCI